MYRSNVDQNSLFVICAISVASAFASIPGTIPPPGSLVTARQCKDYSNFCPTGKKRGYCKSTITYVRNFMETYCKDSCGLCKVKKVECTDKSSYCSYGKKIGDCTSSERYAIKYMKANCKKSCGFCKATAVCEDKETENKCKQYKRYGFCDRVELRSDLTKKCRKTCGLCDLAKTYPCGIAKANKGSSVIGGVTAKKGAWPWQVAIKIKGNFKCGGTLVSSRFVVTAAHCIKSRIAGDYMVVLGEHNRLVAEGTEQYIKVKKITGHPLYLPQVRNDIAVLELEKEAVLTKFAIPACLPNAGEEVKADTKCHITGWGRIFITENAASILQEATLQIVSSKECKKQNRYSVRQVTSQMVCARNKKNPFTSGCHGDSGGPLVCEKNGRMVLQGVVSWGSSTCNALDQYTVFTRVTSFQPWIKKIIDS